MQQDEFAAAARAIDEAADDIAQRVARLLPRLRPRAAADRIIAKASGNPGLATPTAWRSQYAHQFSASSLVTPGE